MSTAKSSVFLDSSVIIAALLSVRGASYYILTQLSDQYQCMINEYTLRETLAVLEVKFKASAKLQPTLFDLLGNAQVHVLPNPSQAALKTSLAVLEDAADAPILISASQHCNYLITLDNGFFAAPVKQFATKKQLTILKPGQFLAYHQGLS